jgi:hypothetical protein
MGLDIRIPLGMIFLIIGGIMAIFGIATHGGAIYDRSLGIDLNLTWGAIMFVFGAIMIPPILVPGSESRRPGEDTDG